MPKLGGQEYVSTVGSGGDARIANKLNSDDERIGVCGMSQ